MGFTRVAAGLVVAFSLGLLASVADIGAADGELSVLVRAATVPVANLAASQTPVTVTCPAGMVLVGGGIRAFHTAPISPSDPYHPINGLVVRGVMTSDAAGAGSPNGATDPTFWTAYGGFAGQSEPNDAVTGFGMCVSGGPAHTVVVTKTVTGPLTAQATLNVVATCPGGMRVVGGGGIVVPSVQPSIKPVGSYPSDPTGARVAGADPDSWTVVGESGGLMNSPPGSPPVQTTALAVCSTDTTLHTTVVRAGVIDHPAGPGNSNPGSDPIATVTATCPTGTTLLGGGALAIGSAAGDDGGNLQQGVHLRGSYPSDAEAVAVGDAAANPRSWSAIVQSGGQSTPGTDSFAYALCALAPPAAPPSSGGSPGSGTTTAAGGSASEGPGAQTTAAAPPESKSATATRGKAGSLTVGKGASAVTLAWPAAGLAAGKATVTGTAAPAVVSGTGGAAAGTAAILLGVEGAGGKAVARFAAPLELRFAGAPGNVVPAWSRDGKAWTAIPLLPGTRLPAGWSDGYHRDNLGVLRVATRHAAYFGLLGSKAKLARRLELDVAAPGRLRLAGTRMLGLSVRPTLPAAVTVTLSRGGKRLASWRSKAKAPASALRFRLPEPALRAGRYSVAVRAKAGARQVRHTVAITFS